MESFFTRLNHTSKSSDASEKKEFEELKHIWDVAGKRDRMAIPDKSVEWQQIESRLSSSKPAGKKVSLSRIAKIAASLLILVASATILYVSLLKADVYQTTSDSKVVALRDGSEVVLNKNSELVVKPMFNRGSRSVSLTGEAYFKVTKARHPFIIHTGLTEIKVVGTQFNVKSRRHKVELAVNEGIVDFCNVNDLKNKVRVTQGYLSNCMGTAKPEEPQKILMEEYPGWLHGKLSFQNNNLADVCTELESSFNIHIEIREDSILNKKITGTLDSSDPDEIIQILCTLIQQNYKMEQDTYVIY